MILNYPVYFWISPLNLMIMKRFLFVFLAFAATSLAAQDMAAAGAVTSDAMIEQLAGEQVKSLAKKFNFTDQQAEQAGALAQEVMKSPKFKKMLGKYSPDQLLAGSGTDMIQKALLGNNSFMKGMKGIASEEQMSLMNAISSSLD